MSKKKAFERNDSMYIVKLEKDKGNGSKNVLDSLRQKEVCEITKLMNILNNRTSLLSPGDFVCPPCKVDMRSLYKDLTCHMTCESLYGGATRLKNHLSV